MSMLVSDVRAALRANADPERAAGQQRYMKSAMPYFGLTSAQLGAVLRPIFAEHRQPTVDAWLTVARTLWDEATHREERYAAIALLRHRHYRAWATDPQPALIDLLRHMIVTGAWWDYVDEIASHPVGDLLRARPDAMMPILRGWARDDDLWLRRTSIICQLRSKERTDVGLLQFAIDGSVADKDFFARKAIGWALREYSKTDAQWVRDYVAANRDRLAPLSVREALKHLGS